MVIFKTKRNVNYFVDEDDYFFEGDDYPPLAVAGRIPENTTAFYYDWDEELAEEAYDYDFDNAMEKL